MPGLPALPKIPVPHDWHKSSKVKRTTWTGTMGTSVVTSTDKGLAGLALALSQVLEALSNSKEGQRASAVSEVGFPTTWWKGDCTQI